MEILDNWVQVVPSTRVVGLRLARQDSHFTFAEAFHPDRYTNKTAIADYWLLCQYYPFTESSPGLYVFDYPADVGAFLKNRSNVLLERLVVCLLFAGFVFLLLSNIVKRENAADLSLFFFHQIAARSLFR